MIYCKLMFIMSLYVVNCNCRPFIDDENTLPINEDVINCYGHVCANDTKYCKKIMKTSGDKTAYEMSIYCIGEHHRIVDEKHFLMDNPNPDAPRIKMVSMNGRIKVNFRQT